MNYRFVIPVLWLFCRTCFAVQTAWISDQLRTSVISEPKSGAKFLGTIQAGEKVTVLDHRGDYAHIKTSDINGWVLARYVMDRESIHDLHHKEIVEIEKLQTENQQISSERDKYLQMMTKSEKDLAKAQEGEEKAKAELISLQRAASNVVAIDQRNRELQAMVVSLEQENLALKHKNLRLSEDVNQRKMYAGGLLVLAGFILNWLGGFFRFATKRRRSFDDL